jgi:UDP-D-galactose:(glucosyl)LPS alpha-1,6-D-galactosyltransferase
MELLVVVGTLSGLGGIEVCVRSLAQEAEAHGDRVRVLALCPSVHNAHWHEGIAYTEVPKGSTSLKKQMIRGLPAFIRACRRQPPDAVVVVYTSTLLLARLGLLLAGLKRPVLAWLHFSSALKQRLPLLRLADGHLCISGQIAKDTQAVPGVRAESVHVVYNGTQMETTQPIRRSCTGPLRLLHVGRLMVGRQKRTDDLLRSLARVEGDWHLDLVGRGDAESDVAELQALGDRLGIADRLRFLGWHEDPWRVTQTADVLVLCSAFEGFPLVLIEAMARGIPCISTDCPSGPSDIVRTGENGWLYDVGDIDALTRTIRGLAGNRASLPARETVRASVETFSTPKVFERIKSAIAQTSTAAH